MNFGYEFEQRGLVAVKGKGELMTYYLMGKSNKALPPPAPAALSTSAPQPAQEEDDCQKPLLTQH